MTRGPSPDVAVSVRSRLLELARRDGVEFQLMLTEFGIERLLYRLGASAHAGSFVLKGAVLFRLWSAERGRATWDLDLLGSGDGSVERVVGVVDEVCKVPSDDGLTFDHESIAGETIRAEEEYEGVRVRLEARLAGAKVPMQLDVAFGDVVHPAPRRRIYPTLLGHTPPRILAYPREAVVSEKLEAILSLGVTNSRMKDFYDLYRLALSFPFEGRVLLRSIHRTFARRRTDFPASEPAEFAPGFLGAPERRTQWQALVRRGRLAAPADPQRVSVVLGRFLGPVLGAAAAGSAFAQSWEPGGPWRTR